jgi:hypothetical protein
MRLRPETRERYVTRVRDKLTEVAGRGETITYTKLMRGMGGPGRGYIGQVLEEICRGEYTQGHPLLGTLVTHSSGQLPGNGFWKLSIVPEDVRNGSKQQQINFWEKERRKVHEYWRKQP